MVIFIKLCAIESNVGVDLSACKALFSLCVGIVNFMLRLSRVI